MTDTVVDKLLQEAIASTDNKIAAINTEIWIRKEQLEQLDTLRKEYVKSYQDACPHELSVRETVSHMDGGYDHVSETQYRDVCTRCRKVTGSKLIRGTYA